MKPVLQALVLAEHVYHDVTGKKIICGTFNRLIISNPQAPVKDNDGARLVKGGGVGAPFAYISLTDVCDNTEIDLQFVNLTRNEVVYEKRIHVRSMDRLTTVELIAELPHWDLFPLPVGTYALEVVCEGEIIGSHRVVCVEQESKTEGGG